MGEKDDFNLTLPIVLIGILAIGGLLFFTLFDKNELGFDGSVLDSVKENQAASAYHFLAPDKVSEGAMAEFSWKADVSDDAKCEGSSIPEGSDGGWSGEKGAEGKQEVGPIDKNTTYFLDCMDGEDVTRDLEIVSVVDPKIIFSASEETIAPSELVSFAWDGIHVESCEVSDGENVISTESSGVHVVEGLIETTTYTFTCATNKEPLVETITINVQ